MQVAMVGASPKLEMDMVVGAAIALHVMMGNVHVVDVVENNDVAINVPQMTIVQVIIVKEWGGLLE